MFRLLSDPHRRHFLLTLLVGLALLLYLAEPLQTALGVDWGLPAVRQVYGFDLAMLLALVGGLPIYWEALSALGQRRVSADLAVMLAAVAALATRQYIVAAEVIFIMLIGEALEHYAIDRTRTGIEALLGLRPETARVRRRHADHEHPHEHPHDHPHDHGHPHHHEHVPEAAAAAAAQHEHELVISAEDVLPSDVVLVRPGDRIAVDGRVLAGHSSVDQSPITGESLPADKGPGDEVFAGTINLYGAMELAVERLGHDTTLEQIIHLVEEAEAAKAPTQRVADRYAAWFVPIVLALAGLTFVFTRAVDRAVAVLVVACPCALVLATPTAIAAGIGRLVHRGILIKGGVVLENLGRLRAVVFDKTGTLTRARLQLEEVVVAAGSNEADVLRLAAAVERHSEHPVARLLVETAQARHIAIADVSDFAAQPGRGAHAMLDGSMVRVGSQRFLEETGLILPGELRAAADRLRQRGATVVFVARGDEVVGAVALSDTPRPEAREAIRQLGQLGIAPVVMLTGDHEAPARSVAAALAIDDVRSGLLPADKLEVVRQLQRQAAPLAMVGDGINDAPALTAADVGVALADIGTDVAIASADLVLVGDDLRKLPEAIACGRRALRIIWQNIIGFALIFNVAAVTAAFMGWISPVAAAVVHQISSLTVVLNSLRLLFDERELWHAIQHRWEHARHQWRRLAVAGGVLAVVLWLASGLHVIGVGQAGIVQHFGRMVGQPEAPGLHYCLPSPLGQLTVVRPDEDRRVEIGFRSQKGAFTEPAAQEWNVQHRGGLYMPQEEESAVWAGDESLIDANFVVHYHITDPRQALFVVGQADAGGADKWDTLVRAAGEACLRAEMAHRPAEDLLNADRGAIANAVRRRMADMLRPYAACFALEAVCVGDVHPPVEVVPAFREVASAAEEKEAKKNDAEAYQFERAALTAAEAVQKIAQAEGYRAEREGRAAGGAAAFRLLADAYHQWADVTRLRLYLETIEQVLAGRRKIIVDHVPAGARRMIYLGRKGLSGFLPPPGEPGDQPAANSTPGPAPPDGSAPAAPPPGGATLEPSAKGPASRRDLGL